MIKAININNDELRRLEINNQRLETVRSKIRCDLNTEIYSLKEYLRSARIARVKQQTEDNSDYNQKEMINANKSRPSKPSYAMTEKERKLKVRTERSLITKEFMDKLEECNTTGPTTGCILPSICSSAKIERRTMLANRAQTCKV